MVKRIKNKKEEFFFLAGLIVAFIVIRSINYIYHLNFSGDQATQAAEVMNLIRLRKLSLIGNPVTSFVYDGRMIFQGPTYYYMMAVFLILGRFDPVLSSYLFLLFCALMILPLYFGIKKILGQRAAVIVSLIYVLTSFYINYSRFLWNPNFQFSLIPSAIFVLALALEKNSHWSVFAFGFILGFIFQMHYQFLFALLLMIVYFFFRVKFDGKKILWLVIGFVAGLSPLILFELRNNFYNIRTGLLILSHFNETQKAGSFNTPHYLLTSSFVLLLGILIITKNFIERLSAKTFIAFSIALTLVLLIDSLSRNLPIPSHAFWAPTKEWNYQAEEKIYKIIKSTNIKTGFNVANLGYDNRAMVTKYFLKRDGYQIDYDSYHSNRLLFVVSEGDYYLKTPAYEIRDFAPFRELKKWNINRRFDMLLLEKNKDGKK